MGEPRDFVFGTLTYNSKSHPGEEKSSLKWAWSACTDSSLDSKERAQFKGLAAKISSSAFLLNLGLMCDALQELSDLSESLQAESINLPKAHRLIVRQAEVFSSRKSDGGVHYQMASEAVTDGSF